MEMICMELDEIWLWYVNEHMTPEGAALPSVELTPWDTLERFFDVHPMFTGRWDAIRETPFNESFDEVADNALAHMAAKDAFDVWDRLPAGAWRVLSDRLLYSQIVLCVAAAHDDKAIIDRLPQGLDAQKQTKALLLKYLLGHGRTIDRRVLPVEHPDTPQSFPALHILRQQ